MKIVAANIADEIDVKKFSAENLNKKFIGRWEEPLVFEYGSSKVFLYQFGAFIAVNPKEDYIEEIAEKLKPYCSGEFRLITDEYEIVKVDNLRKLRDILRKEGIDYDAGKKVYAMDERCIVASRTISEDILRVISFVLAQSISLERIERKADECLDMTMSIVEKFGKKIFLFNARGVVKSLIRMIELRYEVLSNLMILEKPEMVWEDADLEELYDDLRYIFDIDERFRDVDKKLSHVYEISSIISDLISASRENFLEFLIVVLILVEILFAIFGIW